VDPATSLLGLLKVLAAVVKVTSSMMMHGYGLAMSPVCHLCRQHFAMDATPLAYNTLSI